MNKILLLGAQHGNELLGRQLYGHIARRRPQILPFITYKAGNLRAYKQNVRYIESDLNRSYTGKRHTYEERRATRILKYIIQNKFNLVLDLHTTTCEQPPCFIAPGVTPGTERFIRASSITRIVQMNHSIVASSLIGNCTQAISIEVNRQEAEASTLLDALCDDIERYILGDTGTATKTIYHVDDLLKKTEVTDAQAAMLHNFQRSAQGYYPILVGENSYKKQTEYLGFKAYETETIRL
jgi:succinylglutamate desuccinylase